MFYILTYEYGDRSAVKICGATGHLDIALAWYKAGIAASSGEHKVYKVPADFIAPLGYSQFQSE